MAEASSDWLPHGRAGSEDGPAAARAMDTSTSQGLLTQKLLSLTGVRKQRPFSAAGAALSVRAALDGSKVAATARPKSSRSMRNARSASKPSSTISRLVPLQHALRVDVAALARTVFVAVSSPPGSPSTPGRRVSSIPPPARGRPASSASYRSGLTTRRSGSAARTRSRPTTTAGAFASLLQQQAEMGAGAARSYDDSWPVPEVVMLDERTGLLVSHLDLSSWAPVLEDAVLGAILAFAGEAVASLSLAECALLTGGALAAALTSCARLVSLDASATAALCDMTDFRALGALQMLSLASTRVDDACLQLLAKGCHALRVLDLSGCQCVRGEGLDALVASNRHLEVLNLAFTNNVPPEALRVRCRAPRRALVGACTDHVWHVSPRLRARARAQVLSTMTHLKHAYLKSCRTMNDTVLVRIAEEAKQLRTLSIAKCAPRAAPPQRVSWRVTVRPRSCDSVTDLGVRAFAERPVLWGHTANGGLPLLQRLSMANCTKITDVAVSW